MSSSSADASSLGHRQGPLRTLRFLLGSPVRGVLALTHDPHYVSHWKFFRTAIYFCVAVMLGYLAVVMLRLSPNQGVGGLEGFIRNLYALRMSRFGIVATVTAFAGVILYFAIGYQILSRIADAGSGRPSYIKFRCLTGGFLGFAMTPFNLAAIVVLSAIETREILIQGAVRFWLPLFSIAIIAVWLMSVAYEVQVQKLYWGVGTIAATASTAVAIVIAYVANGLLQVFLLNAKFLDALLGHWLDFAR